MKWILKNPMLAALVLVALVFTVMITRAWGSGGDDVSVVTGDTSVKPSSNALGLGLGYGMGDVDINEGQNCMGSEQKANVLWGKQEMELNPWCASLFYELNGRHTFAAKLRCDIPEIAVHYTSPEACVTDQDLSPAQPEKGVADIIYEEHQEDIEVVQMAQVGLEERIEALEQKPAPRPRVVQQAPAPEPEMTLKEKEAILGLLFAEDDEDE